MGIAKFEIRRKCMVCGEPFMAKTIESWYCSPRCSKIAYKRRRDEEIRHSKLDVIVRKISKSQEYVKVSEAYALFGISKDTLYRLIRKGKIPYVNAGKKMIRVSKTELIKMYPLRKHPLKKEKHIPAPQSILLVGRHLVSHLAIFTLVSFAIDSSMVEVLIESCLI